MSYTIAIVVPPVPVSNRKAWEELAASIQETGDRPAIFQTLHDQLTARYPCMEDVSDDEVDDIVWSDGPLIDNFQHRAAILGISFARAKEVVPFVVQTANSLGLVVFDWITETIYRPRANTNGKRNMTLQLESGKLIRDVEDQDIRAKVEGEAFAILSADDNTYLQCAEQSEPPYGYVLEYQEGSTKNHYAATDGPITLERVLAAFVKYLHGDDSWRSDFTWKKVKL